MKNNVLKLMAAVALSMVAVYNVYSSLQENAMTELELANVEALANTEQTPCEGARHCTKMETKECWYYNINADDNMMVSSYKDQIHRGQD